MRTVLSENISVQHGDAKTIARFAWFPRRLGNVRIWLEQYEQLFVYQEKKVEMSAGEKVATFTVGEWIKVSERLITWHRTTGITG